VSSRPCGPFWLLLALLCVLAPVRARAQRNPSTSTQRYLLEATLDPERHVVHGSLQLHFTNHSRVPLQQLLFHLYLNAFRDRHSVFMRETGGELRGERAHGSGKIELENLRVAGEERLPDAQLELIPGDFTQLALPLQKPLAPGESVLIETSFRSQLPPVFARSGYHNDFFAVAQWYPKLAKLEADGHFESFPYHGLGEFYADFADYELRVRTPKEFVVAAGGSLLREGPYGPKQVERLFKVQRVHDMAWFAAPNYLRTSERVGSSARSSNDVELVFMAPPGYELAQREHAQVVRAGLKHFAARFGAYPYKTLSVVIPPRGADGAAGMEYPTLIVTDGSWLPTPMAPSLSGAIVSAHELAHQWFYGLLASNEVLHPVLDEGLGEWATLDLLRSLYGPRDRLLFPYAPERFEIVRALVLNFYASTSPGLSAPSYTAAEYGTSVYGRAALALESIRRVFGKARFDAALAAYTEQQRFGHPTPESLAAAFDQSYGPGFASQVLRPLLFEGQSVDVRLTRVKTRSEGDHFVTEVRARREGRVPLPCWIAVYDLRGKELSRLRWSGDQAAAELVFDTQAPVARVVADPDRALLLDRDSRDQIRVLRPAPARNWLAQLIAATQIAWAWIGP
jgi:hypothetical protein